MRLFNKLALLVKFCVCHVFLSLNLGQPALAAQLKPSMIFDISSVALSIEINVTSISNEGSFLKIKGTGASKALVQQFANGLFHSWEMRTYNFIDAIPFLEKDEFIVILRSNENSSNGKSNFVTITSPGPRESIASDRMVEGQCSREGGDVVIGGDIEGKTQCIGGLWKFKVPPMNKKDSELIAINVSMRMMNQDIIRDYRSFYHPRPME